MLSAEIKSAELCEDGGWTILTQDGKTYKAKGCPFEIRRLKLTDTGEVIIPSMNVSEKDQENIDTRCNVVCALIQTENIKLTYPNNILKDQSELRTIIRIVDFIMTGE